MRRYILNNYDYVEDGTWLCDKEILFLSSKGWLYKFMHSRRFIDKKQINEKDKEPEEIRVIC